MTSTATTALITGASSGIGASFADALAKQGTHLILVARSDDKLRTLADSLTSHHGVQATVLPCDLTEPDAPTRLAQRVADQGLTVDLLINNAGFGEYGAFSDRPRQRQIDMIQLNVTALVDLTYQFLPAMQARRSGAIINVSSIAGFQPMPYLAVYGATKAFVLSFSEALWAEVQKDGVTVVALCPGPTETQFFKAAHFPESGTGASPQRLASPEEVVADALRAIASKTPTVVSGGLINQVIVNLARFFPRPTLVNLIETQFRPPTSQA